MDRRASASAEFYHSATPPPVMQHRRRPSLRGFSLRPSRHVGDRVGEHHRIEGFLGQGGTADVFLARDERTSELVVIKRLNEKSATVPELRQRFLLEAQALASIQHPAVVRVLGIEEPENEAPWLWLEALKGESLGDYLKRKEHIDPELGLRLVRETAHALEAVHAAGIVHRDIKPDNLFLVGPIDDPEHVKVLDFGMARMPDEDHDENSTSILGTAQYMAPEQILVEPVDARTDVYALGVVLFRVVTGHLPFDAHNSGDLLRHQLFSPIPPPSWLAEDLPAGLEEVVLRATRKNPRHRYVSMREFGSALDSVVGFVSRPVQEEELLSRPDVWEPEPASVPVPDVYKPVTERGRVAARVLAKEFGIYALHGVPSPGPASRSEP